MMTPRTIVALVVSGVVVLAACGSDEDAESTTPQATAESTPETAAEPAPETTAEPAPETTAEPAPETTAEPAPETPAPPPETAEEAAEAGAEAPASDSVEVGMVEWAIDMPTTVAPGSVTYVVSNGGEFDHRLAVARGTSYEELPQLDNGAVDTDALGDDFIGEQAANVVPGGTGDVTFDLSAGNYVFFCPIAFGPNSHAGAGQVLSVTVG